MKGCIETRFEIYWFEFNLYITLYYITFRCGLNGGGEGLDIWEFGRLWKCMQSCILVYLKTEKRHLYIALCRDKPVIFAKKTYKTLISNGCKKCMYKNIDKTCINVIVFWKYV